MSEIIKIKCACCGKGLATYIGGDVPPSILPALLSDDEYTTEEVITSFRVDGRTKQLVCLECDERMQKNDD